METSKREANMFSARSLVTLVAAACLLLASGEQTQAADGKVKGIITIDGKPLSAGRIFFHLDNGQFVGSKIAKDGSYAVDRVPTGSRKITIEGKGVPKKY